MLKIPFSIPVVSFRFRFIDIVILLFIISVLSLIVYVASGWRYEMQPSIEISLDTANIPIYSINSLIRIFFAYILSLVFAIWYGYTANRSRIHEKVMIPLLDILQSIPVLSFLPGVVLAMIAIFPHRRLGIELASILLIFTGQVWNMAFSYYNSINTIPRELIELTKVFRLNRFTKFLRLDMPFSAIGSYIQTAANCGDMPHVLYGIVTMIFLIIILDILIWRPLVAWSQKFRMETVQAEDERESFVLDIIRKSHFIGKIERFFARITKRFEAFYERIGSNSKTPLSWHPSAKGSSKDCHGISEFCPFPVAYGS